MDFNKDVLLKLTKFFKAAIVTKTYERLLMKQLFKVIVDSTTLMALLSGNCLIQIVTKVR